MENSLASKDSSMDEVTDMASASAARNRDVSAGGSSSQAEATVPIKISPYTKYIISTSGRLSSIKRYNILLQTILGLDMAYLPINNHENGPIDPRDFVNTLRGMNCIGGAISRDIKHSVIEHLDEVEDFAAKVGSVNTVLVRRTAEKRSSLYGFNTDALGFRLAIQNSLNLLAIPVTKAVCYGYGGVTSVVVQVSPEIGFSTLFSLNLFMVIKVLKSMGIQTYICGRRLDEAARRATELGAEVRYL
jgi:shikimate 5-dehydrogenase